MYLAVLFRMGRGGGAGSVWSNGNTDFSMSVILLQYKNCGLLSAHMQLFFFDVKEK